MVDKNANCGNTPNIDSIFTNNKIRQTMNIQFLTILFIFVFTTISYGQTKCDVKKFYKAIEAENDAKVLTIGGDIEEAEYILVPTKLNEGKYTLSVTRKASNFYKVDGQDLFIETNYCYEYATYDEVILIVESNYGYTKGKIIFDIE
jgi:hypothetical protein